MDITLPTASGALERYALKAGEPLPRRATGPFNRIAFSAAHVTVDPFADIDPWLKTAVDWEATLTYRRYLWDLGLGVAEAMDTAQRGMGVDWPTSLELITRTAAEARAYGPNALLASGVGTDQLAAGRDCTIDEIIAAYEEQCSAVHSSGSRFILMASRALARSAAGPDDYRRVYERILSQSPEPVILHWLGEMFDPALAGYWGHDDHWRAMDVCLDIIKANASKVAGIKVSLLSEEKEVSMRARLPAGVEMFTGDDFNYPTLIAGDSTHHSQALLGIFDAIAPAASAALTALAKGDRAAYDRLMDSTVPLSRHIFRAPTQFYKTGVVFLAWLNGFQSHFTLANGQESARSTLHLAELFRLADQAGVLLEPELACSRMRNLMSVRGVEAGAPATRAAA
ncbi:dihydrodipicolinate synthase family protein [Ancylobacter mangrovi]|uniref:dihydrodipicolinate synthase family protein n=1 Tax=Ancylobacter mangrovi TaxID=2972472 RepID=UPI002161D692|nr:dihydrodipicolinate synthase family protein [Ancylobacter mangrovi]MCS0503357.1 dihydrodipicolinate synthase family protein [Ancylobacter mangrovi]